MKQSLKQLTEREAIIDGISRSELIEAVETAFLMNRGSMKAWVRKLRNWHRQTKMTPDEMTATGLIRQYLERVYGLSQEESMAVIETAPTEMTRSLLEAVAYDRSRVASSSDSLYSYYNEIQEEDWR